MELDVDIFTTGDLPQRVPPRPLRPSPADDPVHWTDRGAHLRVPVGRRTPGPDTGRSPATPTCARVEDPAVFSAHIGATMIVDLAPDPARS